MIEKNNDLKQLYKDATYYHLVHNGCKNERAKIKVEQMFSEP